MTGDVNRISLKKVTTPFIRPEKVNSKITHNQTENEAHKQYSDALKPPNAWSNNFFRSQK
jgi:hypothetical protein